MPAKNLPPPDYPPKGVEQTRIAEKEQEKTKEVAPEATKPSTAPKDSSEDGGIS